VRDAEGAPKGRSRLALRGETELCEPRSSPTPERSEGGTPEKIRDYKSQIDIIPDSGLFS